ncbi:hypothetical protein [Parvicella tangerina]|nr:hypothetical protein [Parvicella tangerina]
MKIIMMNMGAKKLGLIVCLLLIGVFGVSQTETKGNFTFEGGSGLNGYRMQSSQGFGNSTGASWNANGMVGYYFHNRVNVNLEYQFHRYLLGEEDSTTISDANYISSNRLGIGLRYDIVDKPGYRLSVGGTIGVFDFVSGFEDSTSTATIYATGIYQNYGLTNNFYFGEKKLFGLFVKLGIVNNPMTLKDVIINEEHQEVFQGQPLKNYKFNSIGFYLNIGLSLNIQK